MHLALVIAELVGGGAERSVVNLAEGLIDRGHAVDIVIFRPVIDYTVPKGVRVLVANYEPNASSPNRDLPTPPDPNHPPSELSGWVRAASALNWDVPCLPSRRSLHKALAVASYIARERPDCVLPNLREATFASFLACHLVAQPPSLIPILRSFIRYRGFRHKRRDRHMLAVAAHFVAVSHGVADSLAATLPVPHTDITTIYNPVVTADLPSKIAETPNHPWLSDTAIPVILSAGRLLQQKDFPTLIRAFGRVAARRTCRLIILGEGKQRKELEDLVRGLGLSDRVSLPGWVKNPFAFMARAALFVLSSRYEGLPGVLVQALACGCPSVSTDCPAGPKEILQGGKFGPLVPVSDAAALAKAMEEVLDRPPDGKVLQRRATDFSVEKAAASYEDLIAKVVRT